MAFLLARAATAGGLAMQTSAWRRAAPVLAALDAAAALRRHASGEPKQTPEQQQQQQDEQQQDEQQQPGQGKSQDADSPGGASNADQASPERPMEATSAERRSRNPLLRAQMEQLQQLRGETRMIEQHHGDPLPPWQRWVVGIFGGWLQGIISDLMRSRIEEDFDVREWLDGAKDAFWIMNTLTNEGDFATLKPMVSAKLLSILESTVEDYGSTGMTWHTELDAEEPLQAQLRGVAFWGPKEMARFDQEASQAAGADADTRWVVLTVQLRTKQKVTISRVEDGTVVAKLIDWRPVYYKFVNGPLPQKMPVRQLDSPWWLATIG